MAPRNPKLNRSAPVDVPRTKYVEAATVVRYPIMISAEYTDGSGSRIGAITFLSEAKWTMPHRSGLHLDVDRREPGT